MNTGVKRSRNYGRLFLHGIVACITFAYLYHVLIYHHKTITTDIQGIRVFAKAFFPQVDGITEGYVSKGMVDLTAPGRGVKPRMRYMGYFIVNRANARKIANFRKEWIPISTPELLINRHVMEDEDPYAHISDNEDMDPQGWFDILDERMHPRGYSARIFFNIRHRVLYFSFSPVEDYEFH